MEHTKIKGDHEPPMKLCLLLYETQIKMYPRLPFVWTQNKKIRQIKRIPHWTFLVVTLSHIQLFLA